MVYTVVSAPSDPAVTKEPSICPAPLPAIYCDACASMVRYCFHRSPLVTLTRFHLSFNCIVVLTALFLSSCYWQPVTLDTPLYRPWNDNVTTFEHALKTMLPQNSTLDVPVVQFVDRCWCDVTNKVFFHPFNITQWEVDSLKFYVEDVVRQQKKEAEKKSTTETTLPQPTNDTQPPAETALLRSDVVNLWKVVLSRWKFMFTPSNESRPSVTPSTTLLPSQPIEAPSKPTTVHVPLRDQKLLPWWQREYSLRPYGYDITFEFGWNDEQY